MLPNYVANHALFWSNFMSRITLSWWHISTLKKVVGDTNFFLRGLILPSFYFVSCSFQGTKCCNKIHPSLCASIEAVTAWVSNCYLVVEGYGTNRQIRDKHPVFSSPSIESRFLLRFFFIAISNKNAREEITVTV